jgi:hypothetical protein
LAQVEMPRRGVVFQRETVVEEKYDRKVAHTYDTERNLIKYD